MTAASTQRLHRDPASAFFSSLHPRRPFFFPILPPGSTTLKIDSGSRREILSVRLGTFLVFLPPSGEPRVTRCSFLFALSPFLIQCHFAHVPFDVAKSVKKSKLCFLFLFRSAELFPLLALAVTDISIPANSPTVRISSFTHNPLSSLPPPPPFFSVLSFFLNVHVAGDFFSSRSFFTLSASGPFPLFPLLAPPAARLILRVVATHRFGVRNWPPSPFISGKIFPPPPSSCSGFAGIRRVSARNLGPRLPARSFRFSLLSLVKPLFPSLVG